VSCASRCASGSTQGRGLVRRLAALEKLAIELKRLEIEAVAIFFMNSYIDATHERRAGGIVEAHAAGVFVISSTELTQEWYEYERCSTAAANAYVGRRSRPISVGSTADLRARGYDGSLFMMGSNAAFCRWPAPAPNPSAHRIGTDRRMHRGGRLCRGARVRQCRRFHMGGTTAKCRARRARPVRSARHYAKRVYPRLSDQIAVIRHRRGGSGGGSIIWPANRTASCRAADAARPQIPFCYGKAAPPPPSPMPTLVLGASILTPAQWARTQQQRPDIHAADALSGPNAHNRLTTPYGLYTLGR